MAATNNRKGALHGVFERDRLDWYVEGRLCTRALLRAEDFGDGIHDPCCGMGNVVREALAAGLHNSIGTDLKRRVPRRTPWWGGNHDYNDIGPARRHVVCNPPFFKGKGTEAFIRRMLAEPRLQKLAIFTDIGFAAGAGRWDGLYRDHPASRIYVMIPRPSVPPGSFLWAGGRAQHGTANWIWIVWDRTQPTPPAPTFHPLDTRKL